LAFISSAAQADKKTNDQKAIQSMCGCYEVSFNFAETFQYSKNENYIPSRAKYEQGLEWVELVENQPNKLVLQHLLIVNDKLVVKHWRQDWEFENTKFYEFYKDNTWQYKTLPKAAVKGQWTQRIYQVDDSPRYEGTATWIYVDGRKYWTSTTHAPLPRREYTVRSDYNVLKRTSTHEITKDGWIHNQDNEKIIRDDAGNDLLLAKEKGFDVYKKVANSKCLAAQKHWRENEIVWKNIRQKWQTIFDQNKDLKLQEKVDSKPLYIHLYGLKPTTTKAETDAIIDRFVIK
jgi:hypothetical protein